MYGVRPLIRNSVFSSPKTFNTSLLKFEMSSILYIAFRIILVLVYQKWDPYNEVKDLIEEMFVLILREDFMRMLGCSVGRSTNCKRVWNAWVSYYLFISPNLVHPLVTSSKTSYGFEDTQNGKDWIWRLLLMIKFYMQFNLSMLIYKNLLISFCFLESLTRVIIKLAHSILISW